MDSVIEKKLQEYNPLNQDDYKNALKEIFQNIILVALKKSGFFDHGAFYGGTALRIFYGLERFSEDLDFTLYGAEEDFSFEPYFKTIKEVADKYNFNVEIKSVNKGQTHQNIVSAFLKTGTKVSIMSCKAPKALCKNLSDFDNLKVKFEADIEPPTGFKCEEIDIGFPESCKIKVLDMPSLLAGKIHAILFRSYKHRVKGRDYYDFQFLVNKGTRVNLEYLRNKINNSNITSRMEKLTISEVKEMLIDKINVVDFKQANEDLENFIYHQSLEPILKKDAILECVDKLE